MLLPIKSEIFECLWRRVKLIQIATAILGFFYTSNGVAPAIEISRRRAEIYEDQYVANYSSCGCKATCWCVFPPLIIKRSCRYMPAAPHARSLTPHLPATGRASACSVERPRNQVLRKLRSETCGKATKWRTPCRRTRGASAAALKNASSAVQKSLRFPPISSFAACLMGKSVQLKHRQ